MVLTTCRSLKVLVGDLVAGQGLGDDAGRPSARRQCGIGHHAHQADRGAAVDELDAAPGDGGAESLGGRREGRIDPGARAAEHAEGLDGRHAGLPSGTGICWRRHGGGSPDAPDDGLPPRRCRGW